ncbi:MAG: type II and III secretion system protein [Acidobacteria bacterium]|nr:MAG: type II and III secretion system protein [Acidobacteriota bacterium]
MAEPRGGRLSARGPVMKRLIRPAAIVLLVLAITLPAAADKAKSFFNKGRDAEARQNYEQAYEDFKQAYELKPKDIQYRSSYERTRFLAAASHVHRGQLLRDAGKLDDAMAEFRKAAEIDSASFIAQQEIRRTQKMIDAASSSPSPQSDTPPRTGLQKRLDDAQGPVELAPISNVPITLKLTEDTKVIYDTVGKLAGINVLFDPDYTSRRIRIELNGVTLEEALQIIAMESKTFWRPVTPNTIFVASDTPAKRKDIEQSVIKTFYLANLSQPTELQDVVNALRQILEISRIQPLNSQGALVVRGTPDQIALAEKLVGDLDKAKSEVIVEVAVMQVSRDKIRNLGISPPTSATVALQNNINTTTGTGTGTTTTTGTTGGTPNQINLNRIGNLNATDFTVTIPPASATALFSDSSVKLIQNPQIRAVDGQKASLKIGDRVPVATGSFQPGIGGVGINPLVNTQFQYLDVGVNIDITPRVHAGREVTLKVMLDISSVTSRVNIGGIDQPVIGQRKIEHEIRLKEGEVNLLGGILEEQDIKSLSGIPGLAQVPLLKYLFSQTNKEHKENEIVFALIPHIVRGQELSELNQRALQVGTASAIELRRVNRPATPAPAPGQTMAPASQPAAPTTAPPANPQQTSPPQAAAGGATFVFDPAAVNQKVGATFAVNVLLTGAQNVYSVPLQVSYDPKILQVVNISNGGFLSQDGQAVALVHRDDDRGGALQITATRPPGAGGAVVTLTFLAKASGQSQLTISRGGARDPAMQALPVAGGVATVNVR